ncbi:VOC family protein [Pseudonocardia alni]|uniref:VOC family protein n=1 Tax=Pseudonocardia alni TaxID=33907 RepID=UPI00280A7D92|nr:VOC family protein [Pseudonocardia alni]
MAEVAGIQRLVVSVANLERALGLYRGVLGLEVTARQPELAFLRTSDHVELLLHERPVERGDAAVAIGFSVVGLGSTVDQWVAGGGSVLDPPGRQPWGEEMAVVRDVDGHVVTLSEQR